MIYFEYESLSEDNEKADGKTISLKALTGMY